MLERLFRQIVSQVPHGRPAMEIAHVVRVLAVKFNAQEVGEEPVIAKPLAAGVERDKEEIFPFQKLQPLLPG